MIQCNVCLIGITLLFSSVYMTIFNKDKQIFINFSKLLNDNQKIRYHQIIKERITAYISGILAGLLGGLYYYYNNPKQKYPLCTFLAILYITKLGVYYFYPKSPLMLYSLTTKEQTDAWANIYEEMKSRYKLSLLVGFIGYLLIFSSL